MKKTLFGLKIFCSITLGIIFLGSAIVFAESGRGIQNQKQNRVNFSLGGGYAHAESRGSMVDLKAEIQFNLSSSFRAGFGVGYLSDSEGMHMGGSFGGMQGGMMGGMYTELRGGFSGHSHNFRVVPLTMSLYYLLPINSRIDAFMQVGGGYYLGSYKDQSTQNENTFGPHLGIGFDFEIADRISIVAEGLYRFVNLRGFTSELHEGFREGMEGEEHEEGFWHFHHHEGEWDFHEEHETQQNMFMDASSFKISLNGMSLRAGIKFGF